MVLNAYLRACVPYMLINEGGAPQTITKIKTTLQKVKMMIIQYYCFKQSYILLYIFLLVYISLAWLL